MRNANFSEKDGESAKGDRSLPSTLKAKLTAKLLNGGSASEDFPFVLGEGQMLEEFDKGLDGAKAGDD